MRRPSFWRSDPDVSVVVSVYNKAPYIQECIESVLEQPGVSLEVICVDDRSTDGSWEILERLRSSDRRVKPVRHEANLGAARARNTGIDVAKGRFVQFTDADDLLPRSALRSLHDAALATDAEVVRGLLQRLQDGACTLWHGEVAGEVLQESLSLPELRETQEVRVGSLLELPELWIPWFHTCFLVSRGLLSRHSIRYPVLAQGEDPVFLAEVLTAARKICVIPEAAYIYRIWDHRPKPGFEIVRDYFTHAEMVKHVYGDRFSACWQTYEPYIKFDLARLVEGATLDADELRWSQDRLAHFSDERIASSPTEADSARHGHVGGGTSEPDSPPGLSVIIPCRNAEKHFAGQLEALASQETSFPWELIVVDNGSTDRSVSIAAGYEQRLPLRFVTAPDHANQAYARNVGAQNALAEKLVFIDADDELVPGFLAAMWTTLQEHDFVTSPVDTASLNPDWTQHAHAVPSSTDGGGSFIPPLANGCAVGVSRRLLESVGGCPEEYDPVWDLAFSIRVQLSGVPLAFLPSPLVRYRFRNSIPGLYGQTRVWGYYQALAHREFGARVMPRRTTRVIVSEWFGAVRGLVSARSRADFAQAAVRFGYCIGRLQGSLRFGVLYL